MSIHLTPDHQYSKAFLTAYGSPNKTFTIKCQTSEEARSLRFRFMNFIRKVNKSREKPMSPFPATLFAAIDFVGVSQSNDLIILQPKSKVEPLESLQKALDLSENNSLEKALEAENNINNDSLTQQEVLNNFLKETKNDN